MLSFPPEKRAAKRMNGSKSLDGLKFSGLMSSSLKLLNKLIGVSVLDESSV